jgi:hypothetical protein
LAWLGLAWLGLALSQIGFENSELDIFKKKISQFKFILSMMHSKMLFIAKIYNAIIPFPTIRMNHTINACLTSNYALQPSCRAIKQS